MTTTVQDQFTKRLLIIHREVITRGELRFKKNFVTALGITATFYWQVEQGERNFPIEKRPNAKSNLFEKFGVNPLYLEGTSESKFVREPKPLEKAIRPEEASMNFGHKKEKRALLDKVEKLEEELSAVREELVKYKTKKGKNAGEVPDNNPDTQSDK